MTDTADEIETMTSSAEATVDHLVEGMAATLAGVGLAVIPHESLLVLLHLAGVSELLPVVDDPAVEHFVDAYVSAFSALDRRSAIDVLTGLHVGGAVDLFHLLADRFELDKAPFDRSIDGVDLDDIARSLRENRISMRASGGPRAYLPREHTDEPDPDFDDSDVHAELFGTGEDDDPDDDPAGAAPAVTAEPTPEPSRQEAERARLIADYGGLPDTA